MPRSFGTTLTGGNTAPCFYDRDETQGGLYKMFGLVLKINWNGL